MEVSKVLLQNGVDYIMTCDLNDERLEGEFGIFRSCNGGDYYMSGNQVQNALRLQSIKLYVLKRAFFLNTRRATVASN